MTDAMVPNGGYGVVPAKPVVAAGSAALSLAASTDDTSIPYANLTSATLDPVSDVLTLYSQGGGSGAVQLSGNLQGASFGLSSDGDGGTEIVNLGVSAKINDPVPTASTPQQTVILAGSNLQFVNTYTPNVSQGYENAIVTAENFYQTQLSTIATLDFTFDTTPGSFVGMNNFSSVDVSFSQLETALRSAATSPDDQAAVAAIASLTGSITSATIKVPDGLAQVLGLPGVPATVSDTTYLNSTYLYFYNQAAPVAGALDAVGALEHEISEGGLGRVGGDAAGPAIMDLFRYAASDQPDSTLGLDGKAAYFSINGANLLTEFHDPYTPGGAYIGHDSADWDAASTAEDATSVLGEPNQYDAYGDAPLGDVGVVTDTDLRLLDVLGWTRSAMAPVSTVSSGQSLTVSGGQVDSGVTVLGGGAADVTPGGTADGFVMSGGVEFVLSGAWDNGATLVAGGEQVVSGGASASGVTVQSGGLQLVRSGGVTSGTTMMAGGRGALLRRRPGR